MNKEFLVKLLSTTSPSGYETNATDVFAEEMSKCSYLEFKDAVGNVCFSTGAIDPKIKFMISGHVDEIGLQVQNIDSDGFIHFIKDGGIDEKAILASQVFILTSHGKVAGVIGKKPIHVEGRCDEKGKVTKLKDMKIDIGCSTKEEAERLVEIGDPIVVANTLEPLVLGEHRLACHGIDDKVSVFVVSEVMKRIHTMNLKNVKVYGVACVQEETSGSGAVAASSKINPDYSIDYDVTFATDDGYVSANEWGDIKLGKGGCIAHGVDSNPDFVRTIKRASANASINFQEFCVGSGCTNTVYIKQSAEDCKTALLSVPQRNMHTQVEVCDCRDLESLIEMTVATILEIEKSI